MSSPRDDRREQVSTDFVSTRTGEAQRVHIEVRQGVSAQEREALMEALDAVAWGDLAHAYGKAVDVPALLYAVTVATDDVRAHAWWQLWGNIHHQGTVYEATPPSVPFLAAVAAQAGHPDRVNALAFLREVAVNSGDEAAGPRSRMVVEKELDRLLGPWEQQPELVQRALLLLGSAFPVLLPRYPGLVDVLPEALRPAWSDLLHADGNPSTSDLADDTVLDRQDELEAWAWAGRYEAE